MFSIDETNKIKIIRGDTAILILTLNDYSLSQGDQVKLTVKKNIRDSKAAITKVVTEFTEGKAIISLEEKDTKNLIAGDYVYEIEVRLANGTIDTIIQASKFKVLADLG